MSANEPFTHGYSDSDGYVNAYCCRTAYFNTYGNSYVDANSCGAHVTATSFTANWRRFSPDFICYDKIILEIKWVSELVNEHRGQLLNYLSATSCKLGLLVNFSHYPRLEYERILPRGQEIVNLRL